MNEPVGLDVVGQRAELVVRKHRPDSGGRVNIHRSLISGAAAAPLPSNSGITCSPEQLCSIRFVDSFARMVPPSSVTVSATVSATGSTTALLHSGQSAVSVKSPVVMFGNSVAVSVMVLRSVGTARDG